MTSDAGEPSRGPTTARWGAVLARLEVEAGVDLEGLRLDRLQQVATRLVEFVASFPIEPRGPKDPTLVAAGQRQRETLTTALEPVTVDWSDEERAVGRRRQPTSRPPPDRRGPAQLDPQGRPRRVQRDR